MVKAEFHKLGVIGAGVMGQALIQGLMRKQMVTLKNVWAAAKTEASCEKIRAELGITALTNYNDRLADTDVLLLCVKPNGIKGVLEKLKAGGLKPDTLIISIVAGATIETMENTLATENPVIRAMTNTPCTVGQAMTTICGGTHATQKHLAIAQQIFDAVGICMELDESHFNAVTSLAGSGPAYVFLIMEALADGGVRVGLPREAALKIVSQTLLGAATMVQQSGRHPAALRDDVTTPAGCTIGALLTMEDGKIRSVLARAVEEATKIAGNLGKEKK
ncbi:pyrroline-5-carboxylate reductase [Vampirovibrio sp.]|uniref:pyrroline-5-carboxylate reductase n=1 Tax=Vampirovibrio sp. TaxID=2717857 RepID=UPI003594490E